MSHWRTKAQNVIRDALELGFKAGESDAQILARIDAAYPFGERAMHPYKIWLDERRKAMDALNFGAHATARRCPSCGAGTGRPCRPLGADEVAEMLAVAHDAEELGDTETAKRIRADDRAFHSARRM
jgi:hypothetical protein